MRRNGATMPAMQVLVEAVDGPLGNGRLEKDPEAATKHIPAALRTVLIDFEQHQLPHETFADYHARVGDRHHYHLLQQHVEGDAEDLFVDWGSDQPFKPEIGVGECAGVVIDLVSTLLLEARRNWTMARKPCKPKIGAMRFTTLTPPRSQEPRPSWFVRAENQHLRGHHGLLRRNVRRNRALNLPAFTAQVLSYLGGNNSESFARAYMETASAFLNALEDHQGPIQSKAS